MKRVCLLVLLLLLAWCHGIQAQGQLIPGNRTIAGTLNAGVSTGPATAYVLTLNPGITQYVTEQQFLFRAHVANTGAATLAVNTAGVKTMKKWSGGALVDLVAGDIPLGREVLVIYDGTVMQIVSLQGFPSGFTLSGNTTQVATVVGTPTGGNCAQWDANKNLTSTAAPCGSGGGGGGVTSGTGGRLAYYAVTGAVVSETTFNAADVCTVTSVCSGYQAALGFAPVPQSRGLTLTGTTNQINISLIGKQDLTTDRTWVFTTPQDIHTAALARFGSLGLGVAPPASAGQFALTGSANGLTLVTLKRFTDTGPTGFFADYQNAAGTSVFAIDSTGTMTAGSVPAARLTSTTGSGSAVLATNPTVTTPRISERVFPVGTGTSLPCNVDTTTWCTQINSQGAGTLTIPAPGGTPTPRQRIAYVVKCTVGAQTYSFNAIFRFSSDLPAPTTCAVGTTDYIGAIWNDVDSRYDVLAIVQGLS
jgi:hypothetical protein